MVLLYHINLCLSTTPRIISLLLSALVQAQQERAALASQEPVQAPSETGITSATTLPCKSCRDDPSETLR